MIVYKVDEILKTVGHSRYWLAKQMGVTSGNLRNMLNGKTESVSYRYLNEICRILKCQISDIMIYVEDKEDGK